MLKTIGWIVLIILFCGFAIGVCVMNPPYDPTQSGPTPAATYSDTSAQPGTAPYRRLSNPTVD